MKGIEKEQEQEVYPKSDQFSLLKNVTWKLRYDLFQKRFFFVGLVHIYQQLLPVKGLLVWCKVIIIMIIIHMN